jgi:hypothetical protein
MNFITGNKFKSLADDFIDQSKPYIDLSKKPKVIFLYTDWVELFKQCVLPNIDYEFTLITHNADMGIYKKDLDLLEDTRLMKWFGMNCHIKHRKLIPVPIGIANKQWPHGNEELLQKVIDLNLPKIDRIYCNFDPNTNPSRRMILKDLQLRKDIDFEHNNLNQEEYWKRLASYKYVISPPGNSVDCHRIWESIYLGTIPICLSSIELSTFNIDTIESYSQVNLKNISIHKCIQSKIHDFTEWETKICFQN